MVRPADPIPNPGFQIKYRGIAERLMDMKGGEKRPKLIMAMRPQYDPPLAETESNKWVFVSHICF